MNGATMHIEPSADCGLVSKADRAPRTRKSANDGIDDERRDVRRGRVGKAVV